MGIGSGLNACCLELAWCAACAPPLRTLGTGPVPNALPGPRPRLVAHGGSSPTAAGRSAPGTSSTTAPSRSTAPSCACTATPRGRTCGVTCSRGRPTAGASSRRQLGMGFSERAGADEAPWTLAERVDDLGPAHRRPRRRRPRRHPRPRLGRCDLARLGRRPPRPGPGRRRRQHRRRPPPGDFGPPLIRLAHLPGVRPFGCVATPTFVRATSALVLARAERTSATRWPCPTDTPARRRAVGDSWPTSRSRPATRRTDGGRRSPRGSGPSTCRRCSSGGPATRSSGSATCATCASGCRRRRSTASRAPPTLVTEDAPEHVDAVARPSCATSTPPRPRSRGPAPRRPPRATTPTPSGCGRRSSAAPTTPPPSSPRAASRPPGPTWPVASPTSRPASTPPASARATGSGCWSKPSVDLTAEVYAAWRAGAVIVVADKGLGFTGMRRALRGPPWTTSSAAARACSPPGPWACPARGSRWSPSTARPAGSSAPTTTCPASSGAARRPAPATAPRCRRRRTSTPTASSCSPPARPARQGRGVAYTHRQARAEVDWCAPPTASRPRTLRRGLRAVLPARARARAGLVGARDRRDRPAHPDRAAARPRPWRPWTRRGLRLPPRCAGWWRPARSSRRPPRRPRRGAAADVGRRARAGRGAAGGRRGRARRGAAHAVRDDRGAARHDVSLEEILAAGPGEGVCVGRPLEGVRIGVVRSARGGARRHRPRRDRRVDR